MNDATLIPESDARAIVRLLGDVIVGSDGHAAKKRLLMDGLCRLIGGDSWVWVLCCEMVHGKNPVCVNFQYGGFSPEQFPHYLEATGHPQNQELMEVIACELEEKQTHLTRTQPQFDPKGIFQDLEVSRLYAKVDMGTALISFRPLEQGELSSIGVYRKVGAAHFSPREARIAHIVLTSVPWLHEQGWPEDRGVTVPQLSPRELTVTNLLIAGFNPEQIAAALKLSSHTVNDYRKSVYRHFGVSSRSELLAKFTQGDGGDLA